MDDREICFGVWCSLNNVSVLWEEGDLDNDVLLDGDGDVGDSDDVDSNDEGDGGKIDRKEECTEDREDEDNAADELVVISLLI